MYYSFNKNQILLNGVYYPTIDASLSSENQISSLILSEQRHPNDYVAQGGLNGLAKINYYLTGEDFLKTLFWDETTVVSGNFAGLYFNSGYLKSYSFQATPNSPIIISAELVFFEPIKGTPSNTNVSRIIDPLLTSDIVFIKPNISSFQLLEGSETIQNLSFNFAANISPLYLVNSSGENIAPERVVFGMKQIAMDITYDNFSGDLPLTGQKVALGMRCRNSGGQVIETFTIAGQTTKKNFSSQVGKNSLAQISIRQDTTLETPTITGYIPKQGARGSLVTISGENLNNCLGVYFGNVSAGYVPGPNGLLGVIVPRNAISNPIKVVTLGGEVETSGIFTITEAGFGAF